MRKTYKEPLFSLVKADEADRTFFVASGDQPQVPGFNLGDQSYSKTSW